MWWTKQRVIIGIVICSIALGGFLYLRQNHSSDKSQCAETHGHKHEQQKEDWCPEHNMAESKCYLCNPELAKEMGICTKGSAVINISEEAGKKAGIETIEVKRSRLPEKITCNAEVSYNLERLVRVSSSLPGRIVDVRKAVGSFVKTGETLMVVDSIELGEAKSEYLQAKEVMRMKKENLNRERYLFEQRVTPEKELLSAETECNEAKINLLRMERKLKTLGIDDEVIDFSSYLSITSPISGTVIERDVVNGEVIDSTKVLFVVADLSSMWVSISAGDIDLPRIKPGKRITFTPDGQQREFSGTISWIDSKIDDKDRTIKLRATLQNAAGILKANMFGKADILIDDKEAVTVPKEAVQWEGCHHVAFVTGSTPGTYQTRIVEIGTQDDESYEIKKGLKQGERIVTTGSFLMKTEILKGSIGSGCADGH